MNRILYLWMALLFISLVACSRQEAELDLPVTQGDEGPVQLTVIATIGEKSDTKTAVQSNGTSIYWTPGDAINLFYGNHSAGQFTSSLTEPVQTADFSGTLSVATGSTEAGMGALAFWGVYPYNENNTCDGTSVTLTISGTQLGVPGTFADKLNPTVASSPGLGLAFFNVGSWFIFSVTSDDIASATLRGNNNEDLAGKVRVTMDGSGHPVTSVIEGLQSITITPASGEAFVPGELYYMVLRPQTLSGGYTLYRISSVCDRRSSSAPRSVRWVHRNRRTRPRRTPSCSTCGTPCTSRPRWAPSPAIANRRYRGRWSDCVRRICTGSDSGSSC